MILIYTFLLSIGEGCDVMQILVTYDVATDSLSGQKRLRKVATVCKNYGQRVQKSVFECSVNDMQYEQLIHYLTKLINEKEDSLRVYRLREPKEQFVKVLGLNKTVNFDSETLMV